MRRRGFTITEMLWALTLLTMVAVLGTQVIGRCISAIMSERTSAAADASRNAFIQELRSDVWNASGMKLADGALVLEEGGREVRYIAEPERVRRASEGQEIAWPVRETSFAVNGFAVMVKLVGDDSWALPAPRLMGGGK